VRVSDTYFGVAGELVSLVGTQEAALVFGRWPTGTAFGAVPLPRKVCYTYKNVHPPVEYALGGYMAGVLDLRFMACDSAMESVYSHYGGWGRVGNPPLVKAMLRTGVFGHVFDTTSDPSPLPLESQSLATLQDAFHQRVLVCQALWGYHPLHEVWAGWQQSHQLRLWFDSAKARLESLGVDPARLASTAVQVVAAAVDCLHATWEQLLRSPLAEFVAREARSSADVLQGTARPTDTRVRGAVNMTTFQPGASVSFLTAVPAMTYTIAMQPLSLLPVDGLAGGVGSLGSSPASSALSRTGGGSSFGFGAGRGSGSGGRGRGRGGTARGGRGGSVSRGLGGSGPGSTSRGALGGLAGSTAHVASKPGPAGASSTPEARFKMGDQWPQALKDAQADAALGNLKAFDQVRERHPTLVGLTVDGKEVCMMSLIYARPCNRASCTRLHLDVTRPVFALVRSGGMAAPAGSAARVSGGGGAALAQLTAAAGELVE
jgi:hypothetical protein